MKRNLIREEFGRIVKHCELIKGDIDSTILYFFDFNELSRCSRKLMKVKTKYDNFHLALNDELVKKFPEELHPEKSIDQKK